MTVRIHLPVRPRLDGTVVLERVVTLTSSDFLNSESSPGFPCLLTFESQSWMAKRFRVASGFGREKPAGGQAVYVVWYVERGAEGHPIRIYPTRSEAEKYSDPMMHPQLEALVVVEALLQPASGGSEMSPP